MSILMLWYNDGMITLKRECDPKYAQDVAAYIKSGLKHKLGLDVFFNEGDGTGEAECIEFTFDNVLTDFFIKCIDKESQQLLNICLTGFGAGNSRWVGVGAGAGSDASSSGKVGRPRRSPAIDGNKSIGLNKASFIVTDPTIKATVTYWLNPLHPKLWEDKFNHFSKGFERALTDRGLTYENYIQNSTDGFIRFTVPSLKDQSPYTLFDLIRRFASGSYTTKNKREYGDATKEDLVKLSIFGDRPKWEVVLTDSNNIDTMVVRYPK